MLCEGGWWPRDAHLTEQSPFCGIPRSLEKRHHRWPETLDGKGSRILLLYPRTFASSLRIWNVKYPTGTPCYALIWEGTIGAFYEIDAELNITILADIMREPGHRYAMLYGLADSTFAKNLEFTRISDAGKLMALASYSNRSTPSAEEEKLIEYLLQDCPHLRPIAAFEELRHSCYYNVGLVDPEFRISQVFFSDTIFDIFHQFAKLNMKKGLPLLIAGGCGLNCDWNTKWKESGLFPEVFVPPVANDSGSAIGTAIDAQFHYTGNPKIDWNVYSGIGFDTTGSFDVAQYDLYEADDEVIADMLANDLILGWVNGKYEIGPRALGNRSILAAPFRESTRNTVE